MLVISIWLDEGVDRWELTTGDLFRYSLLFYPETADTWLQTVCQKPNGDATSLLQFVCPMCLCSLTRSLQSPQSQEVKPERKS